jgi:hypothetical protein
MLSIGETHQDDLNQRIQRLEEAQEALKLQHTEDLANTTAALRAK